MSVNPNPSKLRRLTPRIHLGIEKAGHRIVVELHRDNATDLLDRLDVFDIQQIVKPRDAEPTDLAHPAVAQKQQLGPRGGLESETRGRGGFW